MSESRGADTVRLLEAFSVFVASNFDLSKNHVRNGVKLGGLAKRGHKLDRYISYKDAKKHNLAFAVRQLVDGSAPFVFLNKRDTSVRPAKILLQEEFKLEHFAAAEQRYQQELGKMMS